MTQKSLFQFFHDKHSPPDIAANDLQPTKRANIAAIVMEQPSLAVQARGLEEPYWDVPYGSLCDLFESIEQETKRLIIHDYLRTFFLDFFERKAQQQLLYAVYLCLNRIGPVHEGKELGLGESMLLKAVASSTGKTLPQVKAELARLGDLGKVVQISRQNQSTMVKPKPLTLETVFKTLYNIASISGSNSMAKKLDKVKFLLVSCHGNEAKYLIRSLEGKLRIGLAEQSVVIALAQAAALHWFKRQEEYAGPKDHHGPSSPEQYFESAVEILKSVISELPVYDMVVPALLEHGIFGLETHCKMTPGIPVKPMLAHPTKSLTEVLDRFESVPFTCEYKYDGERAQIHKCSDGRLMVFSRNLEDMSEKYPDIVEKMSKVELDPSVTSFVLDCEAVAWDPVTRKLLPFQVLSTRKRKDVHLDAIQVQICLFVFDLLFLNGASLLRHSLADRRALLYSNFKELEGHFIYAKHMDSTLIENIQVFLEESVKDGCEGLMVKTADANSSYEPSKRSRNWLKVKKDYLSGAGDSLDLVVIGGDYGRGKRTGVYGGFLLAVWNDDQEVYQPICKIGTGLSEADLEKFSAQLKENLIPGPKAYYDVADGIKPDDWFEAVHVWEIKAADYSVSPLYSAARGLVDPHKGISLRFPRFIRVREDKTPEQATTSSQVAEMYRDQVSAMNQMKSKDQDADEDY